MDEEDNIINDNINKIENLFINNETDTETSIESSQSEDKQDEYFDEEEPEYVNTFEYIQSIRSLSNHNRYITLKTIKTINFKTFIKYFYKSKNNEELFDEYLNIDKILSKSLQNNIISEVNAFLDYKDKIKLILLPEFIFKKYNSPFENNKKLLKLSKTFKDKITKEDLTFINNLVLKRIIFNLYMYKFNIIKYKKNINRFVIPKYKFFL